MPTSDPVHARPAEPNGEQISRLRRIGESLVPFAITFALLLAYSLRQAPIPAVNEPAYLGKAKHFWDPSYCPDDFFFNSSNPHLIFYLTIGPLTQVLSLYATSLIGRIVGYGLMAWGWTTLCGVTTGSRASAPVSAALFLLSQMIGTFSGEWIVGGIEGKVFAYGFAFWGLAEVSKDRRFAAAVLLGLSAGFHPIVGCWVVLCAGLTVLFVRTSGLNGQKETLPELVRDWWPAVAVLIVVSLPGIVPALQSVFTASSDAIAKQANYIHVFIRIKHHVDPMQFRLVAYQQYVLLAFAWLFLWWKTPTDRRANWLHLFVAVTLMFLIGGLLVGYRTIPPRDMPLSDIRTLLLKFYPFRLGDVFLPIAVSFLAATQLERWRCRRTLPAGLYVDRRDRSIVVIALTALVAACAIGVPTPDANPSRMSPKMKQDWLALCDWIEHHTANDAVVQASGNDWAFKWFAQRAQYVSYKDCPQGADEIVEWARRQRVLRDWSEEYYNGSYSADDLAALKLRTGIDYYVARRSGPFEVEPVYRNDTYRLYATESAP